MGFGPTTNLCKITNQIYVHFISYNALVYSTIYIPFYHQSFEFYLEITSSYLFPSEELPSDIIDRSQQLDVNVLLDKHNMSNKNNIFCTISGLLLSLHYSEQSSVFIVLLFSFRVLLFHCDNLKMIKVHHIPGFFL